MMFAIEVEYLTGRSVATNRQVRSAPEWPPHPQRLFASLVAACKEQDCGDAERSALEWLEQLGPPQISASRGSVRSAIQQFVPINDSNEQFVINKRKGTIKYHPQIDAGIALRRFRAPERFFPTVIPEDPLVHYIWPTASPECAKEHRAAIAGLVSAVSYLGHSTSLVRVAIVEDPRLPTLIPASSPEVSNIDERLRTVAPGRLQLLEEVYDQSLQCCRRIEAPDVPQTGYVDPLTANVPRPVFGGERDWFIFERVNGRPLPLHSSLALTSSVRQALCRHCDDSIAALLCGHKADGSPEDRPHVAYIPLAHVGRRYADGEIHGFAVVLPRDLPSAERMTLLAGLGQLRKVWNNEGSPSARRLAFDWTVRAVSAQSRKKTLHAPTWTGPARYWATVTPVVFGHFLRKPDDARTVRIVTECCTAIGLPVPRHIRVSTTSSHEGVPQSWVFPSLSVRGKPVWTSFQDGEHRLPKKLPDGTAVRMRYHVAVEFNEDVYGPVILGAGRYFGMGLCRPLFD